MVLNDSLQLVKMAGLLIYAFTYTEFLGLLFFNYCITNNNFSVLTLA